MLIADERGSVIAGTDGSGATRFQNFYDEYGRPSAANGGRFQYTGQMWLAEAGLYHYKARIYDPGLGRFLQTDPIGYADGLNLYAYVGNDPVNATDPTGYFVEHPACQHARSRMALDRRMRQGAITMKGVEDASGSAPAIFRASDPTKATFAPERKGQRLISGASTS